MGYVALGIVFTVLLGVMWAPTTFALIRLRGLQWRTAMRWLALIGPTQLFTAVCLVLLADLIGLSNPGGYILAIVVVVSIAGTFVALVWPRAANHGFQATQKPRA